MKFNSPLISGTLIQRYKRFLADIKLDSGQVVTAHCPNSGSMLGCNIPGNRVMLSFKDSPTRRLKYTWELIEIEGIWVGINTQRPNQLVREAILQGTVSELQNYSNIRGEVKVGERSRIDLMLENEFNACYVEVKNVTLVEGTTALFPDSVTERGQKHLQELMQLAGSGYRAVIFFVIQREDATHFRPADRIDPEYGHLLRLAVTKGVEILAYQARVSPQRIVLVKSLPFEL